MAEARLNFSDHPDGTFSCQAVFLGGYDSRSKAHQAVRILRQYIDLIRETVPGETEEVDANRPTLETESYMRFIDESGSVRMQIQCVPSLASPSYVACLKAKSYFEFLHRADSDALMTRDDGLAVVVGRDAINARNHHSG